jgi:hypothetical protein
LVTTYQDERYFKENDHWKKRYSLVVLVPFKSIGERQMARHMEDIHNLIFSSSKGVKTTTTT